MNQGTQLELVPTRTGPPRLDPYRKLLARFYEVLFLLKSLGQTRGSHTPEPPTLDSHQARRRKFLRNLSYICEFMKGGDACTAIALEDHAHGHRFWVASNRGIDKIVIFVQETLAMLHSVVRFPSVGQEHAESNFIRHCADFAAQRIRKEGRLLQKYAKICVTKLMQQDSKAAQKLLEWLELAINHACDYSLCEFVYEHRHSVYINELAVQALSEKKNLGPEEPTSFDLVRHYVGRLAHHIRAPKQLLEDSYDLGYLMEDYHVCAVHPVPSVPSPVRDLHTNLRGILNRMFAPEDAEKKSIENGLLYINKTSNIFEDFLSEYNGRDRQVHAEIQVLEHFYKTGISFIEDDRFIACSKPACLCCALYFKHHPARMVHLSSHQKVWPRWSPPFLPRFVKGDKETQLQKRVLSSIAQDLRLQVILQVLQRSRSSLWHPDSRTSFTEPHPGLDLIEQQDDSSATTDEDSAVDDGEHDETWDSDDGGVAIHI
ncbi:hypothetical protein BJX64DRAFT_293146 [Aspergillus heterothallicus]